MHKRESTLQTLLLEGPHKKRTPKAYQNAETCLRNQCLAKEDDCHEQKHYHSFAADKLICWRTSQLENFFKQCFTKTQANLPNFHCCDCTESYMYTQPCHPAQSWFCSHYFGWCTSTAPSQDLSMALCGLIGILVSCQRTVPHKLPAAPLSFEP